MLAVWSCMQKKSVSFQIIFYQYKTRGGLGCAGFCPCTRVLFRTFLAHARRVFTFFTFVYVQQVDPCVAKTEHLNTAHESTRTSAPPLVQPEFPSKFFIFQFQFGLCVTGKLSDHIIFLIEQQNHQPTQCTSLCDSTDVAISIISNLVTLDAADLDGIQSHSFGASL